MSDMYIDDEENDSEDDHFLGFPGFIWVTPSHTLPKVFHERCRTSMRKRVCSKYSHVSLVVCAIRAETEHSSDCISYARCRLNEEAGECEDDLFLGFLS